MTALGSLVGFTLVFLLMTWGASALGYLVLRTSQERAKRAGCRVERCLAGLVLVGPPLFGGAVTAVLIAHSLETRWRPSHDHCMHHLHHAHLCLWHGAAWAHEAWAVAVVACVAMLWIIGGIKRGRLVSRSLRTLRRLTTCAQQQEGPGLPIFRIQSPAPFCMVAGFRQPRIFISTSAEQMLSESERAAVFAHEVAHVQQCDLWKRLLLGGFALLGAPGISRRALDKWDGATERFCDQQAATEIRDAAVVASALIKLVRARSASLACAASFSSSARVDERVHALLDGQPIGERQSRRLLRAALWTGCAGLLLLAAFSDTLHHLLETLLGMV